MTDHSSASIRPPKDWQDFERNCCILFECILDDIDTQNNGRGGQAQHGVDIYGRKGGKGTDYIGIQCKGKNTGYNSSVSENELRNEVEKSRNFTPKISTFILVTTAPNDQAIQEVARKITQEREEAGEPLSVSVWGWGELEAKIWQHDKALKAFHPDATPYSDQIIKNTEDNNNKAEEILQILKSQLRDNSVDDIQAITEQVDKNLHEEIDGYRDLIKEHKPKSALQFLEKLKSRVWKNASDRVKFRILTNITSAKLDINPEKEQETAEGFLDAIRYQPNDKIALANVALAYLLKQDFVKAQESAKAGLQKYPDSAELSCYLIQSYMDNQDVTEPESLVKQELLDTPSVYIALIYFYRRRNNPKWREIAQKAASQNPDNQQLVRSSAEAVLDLSLETRGFLIGEKNINDYDEELLRKSCKDLQGIWDELLKSEAPIIDPGIPHNLAQMYRVLGETKLANHVIKKALELSPNDSDLVKIMASLYLDDGETDKAFKTLDSVDNNSELILMKAEILLSKDKNKSLSLLEGYENKFEIEPHHHITAVSLRIDALLNHPDLSFDEKVSKACNETGKIIKLFPESPIVFAMHSQVLRFAKEKESSLENLKKAKNLLLSDSNFYERYTIAKNYEEIGQNNDVVEVLDGYVDLTKDSPALRAMFFAMINSDQRKKASDLLLSLPDQITKKPIFLNAAIALNFRRGDFGAAEKSIKELLKIEPKNLHEHLNLVDILIRRRDDRAVKRLLEGKVEELEGEPGDLMRLAHLLDRYNFKERALNLAYKINIKNNKRPEIQLNYMGLLMKSDEFNSINLLKKEIGPDTVFSIRNNDGEVDTYIIEDNEDLQIAGNYIDSQHPLFNSAIDKKKGEKFTYDNCEWEVTYVKHKMLHQLHEQMNRFERLFPDNKGIQRIKIEENEEGEKSFEEVLQKLKDRHDAIERITSQYSDNPLPLGIYSQYFGGDIIDLWHMLQDKKVKFKTCHGNTLEREAAKLDIIDNKKAGCVVDALTLHIIRALEIEGVVSKVCGEISCTESTIDVFRMRRENALLSGTKAFMSMFYRDGQYYKEEVTSEQIQGAIDYMDKNLDWIEQQIIKVTAESDQEISEEAAKIRDAISINFLDPILAAQGQNKLLLCEDQSYRQFGKNDFTVKCSWLQPVLIIALEKKIISPEEYYKIVCTLIEAGHGFTSIDVNLLLYAFTKGIDKFENTVNTLFGSDADFKSHLNVAMNFLYKIWDKGFAQIDEKKATSVLLRRIFFGQWRQSFADVTDGKISDIIINKHFRDSAFNPYFVNWLKGHLLIPFDY